MLGKILLAFSLLASLDFSCAAMFKKGDRCNIVSGYLSDIGHVVEIEGTCSEIFNLKNAQDLADDDSLWDNPALANYLVLVLGVIDGKLKPQHIKCVRGHYKEKGKLSHLVRTEYHGIFYYGYLKKYNIALCLHPKWLKLVD